MLVPYKKIPTFDAVSQTWSETTFPDQPAFVIFLQSIFKEPGEYNFDASTLDWNKLGKRFTEKRSYTEVPKNTQDRRDFWNFEKRKCRLGVIWKSGNNIWYLAREYYMLLNFLPITNKEKGSIEGFPDVRDTNYHLQLYEKTAEAIHKHSALVKKRQMLSSYYHCAKLINFFWFEKTKRLKMLASDEDFIKGKDGSWKILEAYRDFLNEHTDWYRSLDPGEVGSWQQKVKVKQSGNRWITKGNKSSIIAQTLKRDPSKSVGGPGYITFYEEAGIAPTMDVTLQFMNPALESGLTKTGSFIAAGSVGDLKDCKPLERMVKEPGAYDVYAVPCKNFDDTGVIKMCGLFIPEQYGMAPFIDPYGNSMVAEATEALKIAQEEWKQLPPDLYRLRMSQKPMTLKQAFDFRNESYFPANLIERRQQIIKEMIANKTLKPLKGIMKEDEKGDPIFIPRDLLPVSEQPPEMEYPVNPRDLDKRGVTIIYEMPKPGGDFGIYFGGVDSIEANVTSTSESLYSVSIVSRRLEVHREDKAGKRTVHYEGGKLVACYTGRYDDTNDTNKQGELLIRMYNALSAVERNKANFINHMRRKGYSRLIAKRREMTLFKEVDMTGYDNDEYGVYMGSDGKANDTINENILDDLTTELDVIHAKNKDGSMGDVIKTIRGVDLIDDYWTLEELKQYQEALNTDRRISFGLAKTLAKCYELTSKKKVYESEKPPEPRKPNEGFSLLTGRPPRRTRSLL